MTNAKWKPDGYHTVTPYLTIKGVAKAIEFYKKAFGAQEVHQMPGPEGKIMHAEIRIGDSLIMLADEFPDMPCGKSPQTLGGSPVTVFMYVENVDTVFNQATAAGATVVMEPKDQFWGDRFGNLVDPFGHNWALATHIEDVSPEEMKKREEQFRKQMATSKR